MSAKSILIIVLLDICWLTWRKLPGEIKASAGSREAGTKPAGTRRVMGKRPKDWPPRVNRWLVTFIIPTQAAQWEASQPLTEEFSHIWCQSPHEGRVRCGRPDAPRLWQRQMSETLSGKTCYAGALQQRQQQWNITLFRRVKEYSLEVYEGLTAANFQDKSPRFMPGKRH